MGFIYTITCKINNKIYVGSTSKLLCKRVGDHKCMLRANKHSNIHLQKSWNKYGEKNFVFEQLDEVDNQFLISTEQFWINILDVYKKGFNRNPVAASSLGIKRSKDVCDKIGRTLNWKKANKAWKGSKHTKETRLVIKQKRALQIMLPRSEETKNKISKTRKIRNIGNSNNQVKYFKVTAFNDKEKIVFKDTLDAIKYLKVKNVNGITRVLRGERNKYKGFMWNALLKSGELMGTPIKDNHEPSLTGM